MFLIKIDLSYLKSLQSDLVKHGLKHSYLKLPKREI